MQYLTLSESNLITFTCPIFDAPTQMRACVKLRDKKYRGEYIPVRRGCQACITASKCPAAEMVRRIAFGSQNATDELSSLEPTNGKLPADVLDAILPVLVLDSAMMAAGVSPEERAMILSANERILKQLDSAPRKKGSAPKIMHSVSTARPSVAKRAPIAAPEETAINIAAAKGDMSAALN